MAATRNSKQRDAVLHDLQNRCDHPTAQEVYLSVKEKIPSISLATVYRNLRLLESEGMALKISSEEGDRFDGTARNHYHFTCSICKRVYDVEIDKSADIDALIKNFGGEVKSHSLMFYGLCKTCKN